jgi:TRAP-type C4-dicarboxylate transport system permease small subunit
MSAPGAHVGATALARGAARLADAGAVVSTAAIAALVVITVVDVAGRYLFNRPLLGAVEVSEFLLVVLAFAGLAYAERRNAHIAVDFFTERLPAGLRRVLDAFATLVGIAFWTVVGWRAWAHALRVRAAQEVSLSWQIPIYPFYLAIALGSAMLVLLLLVRLRHGPLPHTDAGAE